MSATGRNLPGNEVNALGAYDTPPELCRAVVARLAEAGVLGPGVRVLEPSCGSGNWIGALRALESVRPGAPSQIEVMDVDPLAPGLDLAAGLGARVTDCCEVTRDPEACAVAARELDALRVPAARQGVAAAGFLVTRPAERPDLVVGNPPYSVTAPRCACPDCGATGLFPGAREGTTRRCPACNGWPAHRRPEGLPLGWLPESVIPVCDLHIRRALAVTRRHVVFVLRLPFLGGRDRYRNLWRLGGLRAVWTVVGRPSFAFGGTDSVETAVFWWDREWPHNYFAGGWLCWGEVGHG